MFLSCEHYLVSMAVTFIFFLTMVHHITYDDNEENGDSVEDAVVEQMDITTNITTNDNTAAGNNTGIPLEDNDEVTEHVLRVIRQHD